MKPALAIGAVMALLICIPHTSHPSASRRLNVRAVTDVPTERIYVHCTSGREDDAVAVRKLLMDAGALRVNCFMPDVVVCDVPAGVLISSVRSTRGVVVMSQSELEELKPLYYLYLQYIIQLHSIDLGAEEIALSFEPDWAS